MTVIQHSQPTHRVQDRNCVVCETTTARHQCNCKSIMMDLASMPGSEHRHGYLRIHAARALHANKMKGKPLKKYTSRMKHLPYETRQYIKKYPTKDHYIGYGHYPPDVTKLSKQNLTKISLPTFLTAPQVKQIMGKHQGVCWSDTDLLEAGQYNVVPNYPIRNLQEEWHGLKSQYRQTSIDSGGSSSSSIRAVSSSAMKRTKLQFTEQYVQEHPAEIAALLDINVTQRLERDQQHKQELKEQKETLDSFWNKHEIKDGGLSRQTLLSDEWHNQNPEAAQSMFGFSWKDTKLYITLLFKDQGAEDPPTAEYVRSNAAVTVFEKLLISLIRIKCWYVLLHVFVFVFVFVFVVIFVSLFVVVLMFVCLPFSFSLYYGYFLFYMYFCRGTCTITYSSCCSSLFIV